MHSESTCWTLIRDAAQGAAAERERFARSYAPVVHRYLDARWAGHALRGQADDATQDVFVECFKAGGVLANAAARPPEKFRSFLHGVTHNVALRYERDWGRRRQVGDSGLEDLAGREATLSEVFDRAWAQTILREAALHQIGLVSVRGEAASRRVELLRLRFHEGVPIRDVARRWDVDPAHLHHEFAKARQEFKASLLAVLAFHSEGGAVELERECARLLELLGTRGT